MLTDPPNGIGLAKRLREAEEIIETLRNFQADAVVGKTKVGMLRLQKMEDQLVQQTGIAANRLNEIDSIYQNVPVGLCVLDRELRWVRINDHLARISGIPAEDHLGRTVREILPHFADAVEVDLRRAIETGERRMYFELSGEKPDQPGIIQHWLAHWLPLHDENGRVMGINMVVEEITERKRIQECLEQLNSTLEERVAERTMVAEQRASKLREMAMALTHSEEKERRRLALLLHDGLQQLLVGAKYSASLIRSRMSDLNNVKNPLDQLDRILDQSIEASRSLSYDLSPPILNSHDLGPALTWLAERFYREQGLIVVLRNEGEMPEISQGLKVFLFHMVRELLLNVVKHAQINTADVHLSAAREEVRIEVSDHGCGFDPARMNLEDSSGLGLRGFREKLALMNGRMTIEAGPDQGSHIILHVPTKLDCDEPRSTIAPPQTIDKVNGETKKTIPRMSVVRDNGKTTVLVVDDHQIVRSGLVSLLAENPDIEVLGEAGDGLEALTFVRGHQPEVIVMDITMPRMNGIEATRLIHLEFPEIRILGLSMHEDEEHVNRMREAGGAILLKKGGPAYLLLNAIRGPRN